MTNSSVTGNMTGTRNLATQHVGWTDFDANWGFECHCLIALYKMRDIYLCLSLSLSFSNRGPPQEEAPAPTNSNVQHPHPPPTRTQGPSRLSPHSPHQLSPWSSPCRPRHLFRSTQQHSSLPPSLNATHSLLSFCAWVRPLNATTLPQQQLPSLPALEVKFLTLYQLHKRSSFKKF